MQTGLQCEQCADLRHQAVLSIAALVAAPDVTKLIRSAIDSADLKVCELVNTSLTAGASYRLVDLQPASTEAQDRVHARNT
jgi:uncharacterized membrane protein